MSRAYKPADSQSAGTPPAGILSTAGLCAPLASKAFTEQESWETGAGPGVSRVKRAWRAREQSSLCGGAGAAPQQGEKHPTVATESVAEQAAPSFLDTLDITRPTQDKSTLQRDFVQALDEPTRNHRAKRAAKHRRKGATRRAEARNDGHYEHRVLEDSKWYEDRAKGEDQRIDRVLACGSTVLQISCQACGVVHERTQGCRAALYCVGCRGVIASEKRGKFLTARADVLSEASAAGRLNRRRRGGAYGDKFLTLTIPQLAKDTVGSRIDRLQSAWPPFLKSLNRHLREQVIKSVEWFRVIEWTMGNEDALGHPHLHLWLFAPYLDQSLLRDMWRSALLTIRCPPENCQFVVVDIRAMTDPRGGAQELIKYLTKDITAGGAKLPPTLYAQVIQALEGKRQTQASKGFMARATLAPPACECGATLPKRVRKKPVVPATKEAAAPETADQVEPRK